MRKPDLRRPLANRIPFLPFRLGQIRHASAITTRCRRSAAGDHDDLEHIHPELGGQKTSPALPSLSVSESFWQRAPSAQDYAWLVHRAILPNYQWRRAVLKSTTASGGSFQDWSSVRNPGFCSPRPNKLSPPIDTLPVSLTQPKHPLPCWLLLNSAAASCSAQRAD